MAETTSWMTGFLLGGGFQISSIVVFIFIGIMFLVMISIILHDIMTYNKKIRVFCLRGGKYTCYITKGRKKTDKQNVTTFNTKRFGRDGESILMKNIGNEKFYEMEDNLFGLPFLPFVLKECIDFMSPKKGVYIPIRRSFISFKRGQDLEIVNKEECVCCKNNIEPKDVLLNPEKYSNLGSFDKLCEPCMSELIDARYEGVDDADLSYYWSIIEEIEKKWGDALAKYAIIIISVLCLILVGFTIWTVNHYYPDIQKAVADTHMAVYNKAIEVNVAQTQYNNSLPAN